MPDARFYHSIREDQSKGTKYSNQFIVCSVTKVSHLPELGPLNILILSKK